MILCDYKIKQAIAKGQISITPAPRPSQFDSTALNLRVGDDFHRWNPALNTPSFTAGIDIDSVNLSELLELTLPVPLTEGAILNHGPFTLRLNPNVSEVCQLMIECVQGIPKREVQTAFHEQTTPLGTPRKRGTGKEKRR